MPKLLHNAHFHLLTESKTTPPHAYTNNFPSVLLYNQEFIIIATWNGSTGFILLQQRAEPTVDLFYQPKHLFKQTTHCSGGSFVSTGK